MNDATYLQEAWPSLDQVEKRKIVDSITNKIVISKNEVEIDLCYLPSSKDMSKRDRSLQGSNPRSTLLLPLKCQQNCQQKAVKKLARVLDEFA